jgi:hypothetical protein
MWDYRDPLYGFITVDDLEQRIIDTPQFQRLRRIMQLGTSFLVYPSATHTRFEHSLGVLEASTLIFNRLVSDPDNLEILGWKDDKDKVVKFRKLLRLASLLHDIGHPPFSHAGEGLLPQEKKHEDFSYNIIVNTKLKDIIDDNLGDGSAIRVAEIAVNKAKSQDDIFLSKILNGEIGSDRIDYLTRDSYHLGVAYGRFDQHRLLNILHVCESPEVEKDGEMEKDGKGGPGLAIEEGGIHTIEGFILARYYMFLEVYFHKTRRILDIHLAEFLQRLLSKNGGRFSDQLGEYLVWTDDRVLQELGKRNWEEARRLKNRSHFRRAYETSAHPLPEEIVQFDWLEERVKNNFPIEKLRFDNAEKAPYNYSPRASLIYVQQRDRSYRSIKELSPLIQSLKQILERRIYTEAGIRDEVRSFCQDFMAQKTKVGKR